MNDLEELKQFADAHARAQQIPRRAERFAAIRTDEGSGPGSWVGEWSRAGDEQRRAGRLLEAAKYYNMARFPYTDGPARRGALEQCVECFEVWAPKHGIERVEFATEDRSVRTWASGLSARDKRPLVLISGGIVSIKETWTPALAEIARIGMAGVVVDMPGVGENGLRYQHDSWRMFAALLDQLADRADVSRTYALSLSFSGHMALRCAASDPRIRGVITGGVPVNAFFSDRAWLAAVPRITMDTLAHLTGTPVKDLPVLLRPWAIEPADLAALRIPVACTASLRDEIIPAADVDLLRAHVRDLRLVEHDDVHGSPDHLTETRIWGALSVLRLHGAWNLQRVLLGTVLRLIRAGQALRPARTTSPQWTREGSRR
jgi:pimeloyl-ACP methyl ester carboxylesterase